MRLLIISFLLCGVVSLNAQPYKNLIFEGAGIRGLAYAGAIKVLEEQQLLSQIENVGGTSAGAIAALSLALGYNANEIENIIYNTKIQKFNDGKFFFIGGISRMNRNYGWYRGKAFTQWLDEIIKVKTGNADITFRELHERNFRNLYVTGTSLNHQRLLVFSHKTYPDMKIKDAVRISMSIPLYFEAVFIDSTGKIISNKNPTGYFEIMVDGGFTGNFPIFMFDETFPTTNGLTQRVSNPNTLGLRIDSPEQISYDLEHKGLAPININRLKNYVGAFYRFVIENLNRNSLTLNDWQRTVSISSGNLGPKIRKLSLEEKNLLITNGQQAMKQFLKKSSAANAQH